LSQLQRLRGLDDFRRSHAQGLHDLATGRAHAKAVNGDRLSVQTNKSKPRIKTPALMETRLRTALGSTLPGSILALKRSKQGTK
jgi:hypothetical protein